MEKIIEIINYENESHRIDFKQVEYRLGKDRKKNEILKDFLSFANNLSDDDKFIIIGVKQKDDGTNELIGVEQPTDEAQYRQFINEYIEPQINYEYRNFQYNGKTICYFRIYNNNDRPYLFKKDCPNPENRKIDFKYGDGFIRVGTSTKKIGRKEIDDINKNKLQYINRQEDIEIIPVVKCYDNMFKSIDLDLINKSAKSIDIDIEIAIQKKEDYGVLIESDYLMLKEEVEREESNKGNPHYPSFNFSQSILPNFLIDKTETDDKFIVKRTSNNTKFALTIPQNSIEQEVFNKSIIVLQKTSNSINAEVTIRSDDFIKGALKKEIIFQT